MMKSDDFETRKCARDGGSASPTSLGVETITHYRRGDSVMVFSNELGL